MKLNELSQKLKEVTQGYPRRVKVLGRIDNQYLFIDKFHTYSFANRLMGYFTLIEKPGIKTLFALRSELQHQCFLYQYYPDLILISPQFKKIDRKALPKIKHLEVSYNEKHNSMILF
jgi:hypothetical protein